ILILVPFLIPYTSAYLYFFLFFFLLIRPPPISTLFPYTTLFRSRRAAMTRGPFWRGRRERVGPRCGACPGTPAPDYQDTRHNVGDRKSTRLNSSHVAISYAVFCLKKKKKKK